MAVRQDTLWAQYLFPVFQNLLDKQKIAELQDRIDWQAAIDIMLAIAEDRSSGTGVDIQWQHGTAESTKFAAGSFDLITAALLFHETPPAVTQTILAESYRLLSPGGKILILDGNQRSLRSLAWLNHVFEEPYIQSYAAGNLDAWVGKAGFDDVRTKEVFGIHQVTRGVRG